MQVYCPACLASTAGIVTLAMPGPWDDPEATERALIRRHLPHHMTALAWQLIHMPISEIVILAVVCGTWFAGQLRYFH